MIASLEPPYLIERNIFCDFILSIHGLTTEKVAVKIKFASVILVEVNEICLTVSFLSFQVS